MPELGAGVLAFRLNSDLIAGRDTSNPATSGRLLAAITHASSRPTDFVSDWSGRVEPIPAGWVNHGPSGGRQRYREVAQVGWGLAGQICRRPVARRATEANGNERQTMFGSICCLDAAQAPPAGGGPVGET